MPPSISREDLAWVTGLYEGEGCCSVRVHKPDGGYYPGPAIQINMTDEDILRRAQEITGMGSVTGPRARPPHKPLWTWSIGAFEQVQALIAMMWPMLGIRRKLQAKAALAVAKEARRNYRTPYAIQYFGKRHRDLDTEELREYQKLRKAAHRATCNVKGCRR